MTANHPSDSSNRLNDSDLSNPSNKKEKHDVLPHVNNQQRKRSNSLVHWMQKPFTYVREFRKHPSTRKRSETTATHHPDSALEGPSVSNRLSKEERRPRSQTMESVKSKQKKTPPPIKRIYDTDPRAQQSVSMSRMMFV